jgi:hypothetical protein
LALREFHIRLTNQATATPPLNWPPIVGTSLHKIGDLLCHGVWTEGFQPPDVIKPSETVEWRSESEGWLRGTEGYVVYEFLSDDTAAKAHGFLCITWVNAFVSYDSRGGTRYSVTYLDSMPTLDGCTIEIPNPASDTVFSPEMGGYTFSEITLGNADLYDSGSYEITTIPGAVIPAIGVVGLFGTASIIEHALLSLTLVNCSESCKTQFGNNFPLSSGIRSLQPDGHPNISVRSIMRLRNLSEK